MLQQPTFNFSLTDNELLEKWGSTGFLDNVYNEEVRLVLATVFEYIAANSIALKNDNIPTFASARRVVLELNRIRLNELKTDISKIKDLVDIIINRFTELYTEFPNGFDHLGDHIDWEAEYVRSISTDIAFKFNRYDTEQSMVNLSEINNPLVGKWGMIGFLDGIKSEAEKIVLANIFEIAASHQISSVNANYSVLPVFRFLSRKKIITRRDFGIDYAKVGGFIADVVYRTNTLYEKWSDSFGIVELIGTTPTTDDFEATAVTMLCNKIIKDYSK